MHLSILNPFINSHNLTEEKMHKKQYQEYKIINSHY